MKILYDHQIFSLQRYGGISRYFCELLTRYRRDPAIECSVALRFSQNEHLLNLPSLDRCWSHKSSLHTHTRVVSAILNATRSGKLHILFTESLTRINQRESERLLKQQNFDLLHITYYNPYFKRQLGKKPYVITVYDMIHEIFPEYFPPHDPVRSWKRQGVEDADAVIAISASTKADLVRLLDIDPGRIRVIHLANPLDYGQDSAIPGIPVSADRKVPYLLFVGNRSGYKNFDPFIRAAAELLHRDPALEILCAGGGKFTPRENKVLEELRIAGQVHHNMIPDDHHMKDLYRNAKVFVFPSLYEGFGLPVLEAFSANCPVIASNTSSLPEIGGDAAMYFNPSDPSSMASVLERVLDDDKLQMQMSARGQDRLKAFSWEKTARETKEVYLKASG